MAGVLLGYAPIDRIHDEFTGLVEAARQCADAQLPGCLERLHEHLVSHFGEEDRWMRESGFPAADCHMDEHARVLESAEQVAAVVAAGRIDVGRAFADELASWFPGHADYLDSALAAWMCKRQYGGRPVAIHRRRRTT